MTSNNSISPTSPTQLQSEVKHTDFAQDANLGLTLDVGLYIVSTPIGNLRDITLRALDVLTHCDHILAEDTRQSLKLLSHYKIKTSLSPYHDHNAAKRVPKLVESLKDGKTLALISDAGTPLVSDPGYKLVQAALEAGVNVVPVPGASAVLAALTLSGLPSERFSFGGFLPPKSAARKRKLESYSSTLGTLIFFETGPRLAASLTDIKTVLGDRPMALTRELTKRYEEGRYGHISEVLETVKSAPPKGEIVICIGPLADHGRWEPAQVIAALPDMISELGVKRASESLANDAGWAKRDVYQLALQLKNNKL